MEFLDPNSPSFFFSYGGGLLVYIVTSYCLYKIAKKLNRTDAWAAFIPVFNIFYVIDLAGSGAIGCIGLFIPIVNIVIWVLAWGKIAEKLGKPSILGLLALFPPFTIILTIYLAFL
jgi:hypothetical protein